MRACVVGVRDKREEARTGAGRQAGTARTHAPTRASRQSGRRRDDRWSDGDEFRRRRRGNSCHFSSPCHAMPCHAMQCHAVTATPTRRPGENRPLKNTRQQRARGTRRNARREPLSSQRTPLSRAGDGAGRARHRLPAHDGLPERRHAVHGAHVGQEGGIELRGGCVAAPSA